MPVPKLNVTRYRQKARDPQARAAHAADTTSWRRSIAEADFGPEEQVLLFKSLRADLPIAAAAAGMTVNGVYGRARWDGEFGDALETVLAETCPARTAPTGDMCGRPVGVRRHGGHCADCRRAYHPPRARQGRRAT
jgi:hypothetical protein